MRSAEEIYMEACSKTGVGRIVSGTKASEAVAAAIEQAQREAIEEAAQVAVSFNRETNQRRIRALIPTPSAPTQAPDR